MLSLVLARTASALISVGDNFTSTQPKSGGWTWGRSPEPEFDGIVVGFVYRRRRVVVAIPRPTIFISR